jgi:site-specific DNA-methyltransferase (adenine-specific)
LKLLIDAIFCPNGGDIKNEIIWCYRRYTAVSSRFQKLHDIIFFYGKSDNTTFNQILIPYTEKSGVMDSHYKQDDDGKWYRNQKRKGAEPYKVYLSEGVRLGDWWDMPIINASAKERLGYPTQKPEALLERIITASSNKGDLILDAYCGCGTTVAVANRLERNWIGIDITYQSISLILKRLEDTFGKSSLSNLKISGVPEDFESAEALAHKEDDRTRKEFEKWAVLTYSDNRAIINEKKGGDGGIDGIAFMMDRKQEDGAMMEELLMPVLFSVKSDKKPLVSYIRDLNGTMERDKAVMGFLITLYPADNLVKESKKYGTYKNKLLDKDYQKIQVICIDEILKGMRMPIPTTHEIAVVKSAEAKAKDIQHKLEL